MKMDAADSFKILIPVRQTTRRHAPQQNTEHIQRLWLSSTLLKWMGNRDIAAYILNLGFRWHSLLTTRSRRNGYYSTELLGNNILASLWNHIAANIKQVKLKRSACQELLTFQVYRQIYCYHHLTNISVYHVKFEIITPVVWNVMPCRVVNNHIHFGKRCYHHVQSRSLGSKIQQHTGNYLPVDKMSCQQN